MQIYDAEVGGVVDSSFDFGSQRDVVDVAVSMRVEALEAECTEERAGQTEGLKLRCMALFRLD